MALENVYNLIWLTRIYILMKRNVAKLCCLHKTSNAGINYLLLNFAKYTVSLNYVRPYVSNDCKRFISGSSYQDFINSSEEDKRKFPDEEYDRIMSRLDELEEEELAEERADESDEEDEVGRSSGSIPDGSVSDQNIVESEVCLKIILWTNMEKSDGRSRVHSDEQYGFNYRS